MISTAMTKEEITEFLNRYMAAKNLVNLGDPKNIVPNKLAFNKDTSLLIEKELGIKLDQELYIVSDAVPLMISAENERRRREHKSAAAAVSIARAKDSDSKNIKKESITDSQISKEEKDILLVLKMIEQNKTKGSYSIANKLIEEFSNLNYITIKAAIRKAGKTGVIDSYKELDHAYSVLINKRTILNNLIKIKENNIQEDKLIDELSKYMVLQHRQGIILFGNVKLLLQDPKLSLTEDQIDKCIEGFYCIKGDDIITYYTGTNLTIEKLAEEIEQKYSDLDMREVLLSFSMIKNPKIDITKLTLELYKKDDEKEVRKILNRQDLNPSEYAKELINLKSEYPDWCFKITLNEYKEKLPIDEIYIKYISKGNPKKEVELRSKLSNANKSNEAPIRSASDENLETQLTVIPPREIATLPDVNEEQEPEIDELSNQDGDLEEWTIISKEKATKKIDKKINLALFIAGAGMISTIFLTKALGINPMEAARRCMESMGDLSAFKLSQFLPSAAQLTGIFAATATTFLGTINYLKNMKKKKKIIDGPEEVLLDEDGKIADENFGRRR